LRGAAPERGVRPRGPVCAAHRLGRRRRAHARAPRLFHARRHRRPGPRAAHRQPRPRLSSQYAFGDTELASRRLALVAEVFDGPTRDFIFTEALSRPPLALDLGCGPGHTTRLLAEITGADRVV